MSDPSLCVEQIKDSLIRLRHGHGLARPTAVLSALSEPVRAYLTKGTSVEQGSADEVAQLVAVVRRAIDGLVEDERLCAEVDLNLVAEHRHSTLTERQESLARLQKCAAKTVRRHADRALDTLAYLLLTNGQPQRLGSADWTMAAPVTADRTQSHLDQVAPWSEDLRAFWRLSTGSRVDIVCSEIPEEERPDYASPADRNYLRYAKFADLDTLIYLRTRFAHLGSTVTIRDFAPSEYYDTQADVLVVVGGPPWNAKYREFLPQLPFYFEPHALGEDDPLIVPSLDGLTIGPRWTERQELLEDIAVFTRLTLAQGTTVFLLGGCLTLGVLGAAHCLLEEGRGARSVRYVTEQVGQDDFVLVTEARRIGGITDVADLTMVNPMLLLRRRNNEAFNQVIDNTYRYIGRPIGKGTARCSRRPASAAM